MQYRDYENYINNPTLSYEEQDNYDRGTIFQVGLISSLPPAALLIMNRARRIDRRRHRLSIERDHLERVKKGYEHIGSPQAKASLLEAEYSTRLQEMRGEIEEIRALQTDPNIPEDVIRQRTDRLLEAMGKTVKDLEHRPYDIYGNVDSAKQARSMDILLNTQEYDWNRALAGESVEDSLKRLEAATILVEHRNVIGNVHAPRQVEDLTLSGQKFYTNLQDVLKRATANKPDAFNIDIVPSKTGTYSFKVTIREGHLRGKSFVLDTHQFAQDHHLLTAMKAGTFDSALENAHMFSNDFRVGSQLRHTLTPVSLKGGKMVQGFATLEAYKSRGSASNFFGFLVNALGKPEGLKTAGEIIQEIVSQNQRYLAGDNSIAFGKSEDSILNSTKTTLQMSRYEASDAEKTAEMLANRNGFYATGEDSLRDIEAKQRDRFWSQPGNGMLYYEAEDAAGNEVLIQGKQRVAGKLSSPSGIPKGKLIAEEVGQYFSGGSPMGKQPLGSNIVVGAGLDFLYQQSRQEFMELKAQGKQTRRIARKAKLMRGSNDFARYDFVNQKKLYRAGRESGMGFMHAAFGTQSTIVMVADEEALGVSRDQVLQLSKFGGNGLKDIVHNKNIDLAEVTQTLVELDRHTLSWNGKEFTYDRTVSGQIDAKRVAAKDASPIMRKIDSAIKDKVNFVLLNANEASSLGVQITESRRAVDSSGKATNDYIVFFEEDHAARASGPANRKFRLLDGKNSLVGDQNNKISIKATMLNVSKEQVSDIMVSKSLDINARKALESRLKNTRLVMGATLVEKEFGTQIAEGTFKKVLSEVLNLEFKGMSNIDKAIYGVHGKGSLNRGFQNILEFTPAGGTKEKNIVRLADRLFSNLVLGKELTHGPETGGKIERIFKHIRVRTNAETGEVTGIDYEFHKNATRRIEMGQTSRKLLNAIKQNNIALLKQMEADLHGALTGFKAKGESVLYSEETGTWNNRVKSAIVGTGGNNSKVRFLDIMLGHGTPEGHQVYSSYAAPYMGKYLLGEGPKMNMFDIQSLEHMNPLFASYLKQQQSAAFMHNTAAASFAAQMNRQMNNTMLANQGEAAKQIRKHLEGNTHDSLIERITAKAKRDIINIDKSLDDMADTFSGKSDPAKVLEIVRKAKMEGVPYDKISDYLTRELGINEFWFDNKDSLERLKEFSQKRPVTQELLGTSKANIGGIKLAFEVPLYSTSGTTSAAKSDFLLYRQIDIKDLKRVTTDELINHLDHLDDHQKDLAVKNARSRLERLHAAGKTNILFMADDYTKNVLQLEYINENMKQLNALKKSGRLSKSDAVHMEESINIMKAIASKAAQNIQMDSESQLHGKNADLGKVVTQFSANLKIQRSDALHDVVPGLDWRTMVIGKEQANQMVKSHFIIGNRAANMLKDPILGKYMQHIGTASLEGFEKELNITGTPFERLMKDTMANMEDAVANPTKSPQSINKYRSSQLRQMRRRMDMAEAITRDMHSMGLHNPYQKKMHEEMTRIKNLGQVEDYRNITQLRKAFSEDGLYGKIKGQFAKDTESTEITKLWEDMHQILDSHRIANNRQYLDQGRLWEGWKGIGERLNDKHGLRLITESINKASAHLDVQGREQAQELLRAVTDIANKVPKLTADQESMKQYERDFGDAAGYHMVMDDIASGTKDIKKLMDAKSKIGNHSQLSIRQEAVSKRARKMADRALKVDLISREFDSLMSFNSDEEISKLMNMTDEEIDKHAEQKVEKLITWAEATSRKVITESAQDHRTIEFGKKMADFITLVKGQSEETSFAKEVAFAMKGIKGLHSGMTVLGKADPDIFGTKHMQYFTLKMLLESDVNKMDLSAERKQGVLSALKTGKMHVGHVAAQLLDRDFDGDSLNVYASIIDQRFGLKKGNLSVHNVVSYMNDFSFTFENGSFIPTNATSAVKSELLFNEKSNAQNVVMDSAKEFIRKRMHMEKAAIGFLDKDPGGTFDMEKMIHEAENMWIERNHGKKALTDAQRQDLLANTYVISEVKGLVKSSGVSTIQYGTNGTITIQGAASREAMGLDAYSKRIANKYGLNIGTNKDSINQILVNAEAMRKRAMGIAGDIHTADPFTNALLAVRDFDLGNQRNLEVQKTATGELYKYPTLMRSIADTVIKEGTNDQIKEAGRMMGELAQMGTYSMQEKIAIAMKKGGVDAVQGVNDLFRDMFSLGNIQDREVREKKVSQLYERVSKEGLRARLTGSDEKIMQESKYLRFRTGSSKNAEMKFMNSMEILNFGYMKQAALESMIAGNTEALDSHLKKHYEKRTGLTQFSQDLLGAMDNEAKRLHSSAGAGGSMQDVYKFMLREQANSNTSMAENHKAVVRFSEMGFHSVSNLLERAGNAGELTQVRQMLNIVGSTLGSEGQVLLPEQLRKTMAENKSKGLNNTILGSLLHFMNHTQTAQGDAVLNLMSSGKKGNNVVFKTLDREAPSLLGKAFFTRGAGIGLGILGLGALAPSPTVGRNSNSVVDKADEYSMVLPEKMMGQYNNQANIVQVNPWVSNRLKQEKAESARFNNMFYKTLTG